MNLGDKILNATDDEKKIIKDIEKNFFKLLNEGRHEEARKYLMHLKKKYEPNNSK